MSNFSAWFNRVYKRWIRSQAGEEDFLAFCDSLGYPPAKVLGWLHGEFLPEGPEVLSIAGVFGINIYQELDLPKPDPEFWKIYASFTHLHSEDRVNLAHALWEAQTEIQQKESFCNTEKFKIILAKALNKWGF